MNLRKRFVSWWVMFAHLIRNPSHSEVCWTYGPRLFGIHIGWKFKGRWCHTCGYLKEAA